MYKDRNEAKRAAPDDKKLNTMDIVLIIVGVALLAFTVCMIRVFLVYGAVPDTLVTCVFAALGGECGIMGWIKNSKEKYRDRQWQSEDARPVQNTEKIEPERDEPEDAGS